MAYAMGYVSTPYSRAEIIKELRTQDVSDGEAL